AARHQIIVGGVLAAARVAGHGARHAGGVLDHALHAPEAAAGEHGGLDAVGIFGVEGGGGNDHGLLSGARRRDREGGKRQRADGGGAERKEAALAAGHGFLVGRGVEGSLERRPRGAIGWRSAGYSKIRAEEGHVTPTRHTVS